MNIGKKIPPMFTSPLNKRRKLSQSYIILRTDAVISQKDFIKSLSKISKEIRNQIPKKVRILWLLMIQRLNLKN